MPKARKLSYSDFYERDIDVFPPPLLHQFSSEKVEYIEKVRDQLPSELLHIPLKKKENKREFSLSQIIHANLAHCS